MKFIPTQTILDIANKVFAEKEILLKQLLPFAEIHHVGSTAIPESVTKGDLDINIRVTQKDFDKSVEILKKNYVIAQPQNWNPYFASFQDNPETRISTGIQLSVIRSKADIFLKIKEVLLDNPEHLREYNKMKQRHEGDDQGTYWITKDAFFKRILEDN